MPAGGTLDAPVIVGAGLAGLICALDLAPLRPIVLTAGALGEGAATAWAQGGIAAALEPDDSPTLHLADTLAAGAGLVDPAVARRIVEAAPAAIARLRTLGVHFDAHGPGLEAGHSRRRILHAGGDATGQAIHRALIEAVRADPRIRVLERTEAVRLLRRDGRIAGLLARTPHGPQVLPATRIAIATGGAGALWAHTTNPRTAIGAGLSLALDAGATLADLEFIQFHPTALDTGRDPMPLISEAVRGEGAVLRDAAGDRFMAGRGRAELEPRDIVARAVWHAGQRGQVFLDATHMGDRFAARFPGIARICAEAGIDPGRQPIPVRPAAHYTMGGIATDAEGRSTVPGLWACGEAARTGLHGANRLASNSLLEAAVTGAATAASIAATPAGRPAPLAPLPLPASHDLAPVRAILSRHAGVLRTEDGLADADAALRRLPGAPARLARAMVRAMRARPHAVGSHFVTGTTAAPAHAQAI